VTSQAVDVIVIDSVAALTPKAEIEGEMGDSHMGLQARMMSQALRKLTACVSRANTCLVFINQLREKIGVMFGNPETTTGGRALKFYASIRVEVRRATAIKDGEAVIGNRTKVKIVKGERIGQGRDNARQTLLDRPELCRGIEAELRQVLGLNGSGRQNASGEFELTTEKEARKVLAIS
jgi:RecA/RadA recombinase